MLEDKLGLDHEANSQITDGGATGSRLPGGTSVGRRFANVFQRQRGPADPPEAGFCADTPRNTSSTLIFGKLSFITHNHLRLEPTLELSSEIYETLSLRDCDIRCELDLKRVEAQKNKHGACVLTLSSHTQLLHCLSSLAAAQTKGRRLLSLEILYERYASTPFHFRHTCV